MHCKARTVRQQLAAFLLLCGFVFASYAQIPVPPVPGRVIDQTGSLSTAEINALSQTLAQFEAKKGTQITVLMIASTAPESIEQTALRVAEKWQLGRKKIDDGAILLIAKDDRAVRIEVGYGLEGALNDATSKRIIEQYITPEFRNGNYFAGINAGIQQMIRIADGEPLPPVAAPSENAESDALRFAPVLFMLALAIGTIVRVFLGRTLASVVTGAAVTALAWMIAGSIFIAVIAGAFAFMLTLLGGLGSGRGGGGWSSGAGGGFGGFGGYSGGGGSSGGGFSGGGGSFGGGGASGKW